jgi:hypothetical protein
VVDADMFEDVDVEAVAGTADVEDVDVEVVDGAEEVVVLAGEFWTRALTRAGSCCRTQS